MQNSSATANNPEYLGSIFTLITFQSVQTEDMALTAPKLVVKDAVHQIPVIKETVPVSVCLMRTGSTDDVQVRFLYINCLKYLCHLQHTLSPQ